MAARKIWIDVKRLDLPDEAHVKQRVTSIDVREDQGSDEIKSLLRQTFNLQDTNLVLKLRNHRGSLIPVSSNIPSNSKSIPYTLEVVEMYQNVKPKPRSIKRNRLNETMKKKILEMMDRIEKLEKNMPELNQRRNAKITAEMEVLESKLGFLNKRFMEAENTDWKGMFKKNPLW